MAISVRQLHPVFVGEVTGVDLSRPVDPAVMAEIEAAIFQHAHHPKSFVSLEDADHLLSRRRDADYVAGVITGLTNTGSEEAAAVAALMQKELDKR